MTERRSKLGIPQERLPERRDEILVSGARLRISVKERQGEREMEIEGDRKGLLALAAICSGLAELTSEQLLTPANHYHLDEAFWGTEKGSVPLIVWCREEGWPESEQPLVRRRGGR
jgi:hypothetical protein